MKASGGGSGVDRSKMLQSVSALKQKLPAAVKTLIQDMDPEWCYHLSSAIQSDSFTALATFVEKERTESTVFPPAGQVSLEPV